MLCDFHKVQLILINIGSLYMYAVNLHYFSTNAKTSQILIDNYLQMTLT